MLHHIYIKNFTIIEQLELELDSGMTVLTGETGAGKSIIIDAVEFALGKRASSDIIQHKKERADVTLTFDITNTPSAKNFLTTHSIDHDNECMIRRTITKEGRSKSYINSIPVTIQILKKLADSLINIHGQHEFQTLLHQETQLALLDRFGKHNTIIEEVNHIYKTWQATKEKLEETKQFSQTADNQTDLLKYQLHELEELNFTDTELETLNQEHKQLANADTLLNNCNKALNILSENEPASTLTLLNQALQFITEIQKLNPKLTNSLELLNTAIINTEETTAELKDFLTQTEINPERLSQVEQRLNKIHDLSRKHHINPPQLPNLTKQLQDKLIQIENSSRKIDELQKEINSIEQKYLVLAKQLTQARQKTARKLITLVTENICALGMPKGKFNIEFIPKETISMNGSEKIMFLVTTNPGIPLSPIE